MLERIRTTTFCYYVSCEAAREASERGCSGDKRVRNKNYEYEDAVSKAEAMEILESEGWEKRGGRWICPAHAERKTK
jgi:hypothetical protein